MAVASSVDLRWLLSIALICYFKSANAVCERSPRILAAEDICWTNKVKIVDRIQYTTKSVLNFAKEKLGLSKEEPFYPQQCDYYECVFSELHMLNDNGFPNYKKIVEWIDNNIIYKYAKIQYDRLTQCTEWLSKSMDTNTYFTVDQTSSELSELPPLQENCEILQEFMKCLALNGTECTVFQYP